MKSKKIIFILICLILTGCAEKTYTINFNTEGGSIMDSVNLKEGETIENIDIPTKEGYLFVSWLKDGIEYNVEKPITEDLTLTANWIEAPVILNNYNVTFIADDKKETIIVKENDIVNELPAPEKPNYLFIGWYIGDQKYNFNEKVTKDLTLVAKYEYNVVTVTYELDGGIGIAFETIQKNTSPTIPNTPVKKGYRFLKWTLNDKEFSFTEKVSEDITLKAVWEKIEYVTITFEDDDGQIIKNTIVEKYSKVNKLPIPTKEGYTFKEWQLNNQTFNPDTVIQNDITLKAVYEANE